MFGIDMTWGRLWYRSLLFLSAVFMVVGCQTPSERGYDDWSDAAYWWHYRDIDSTIYYARKVLLSEGATGVERAEALNHLVFASIVRMDYEEASALLDSLDLLTDNQVELLVGDVQRMRLCQRQSRNRDFYEYKERAERRMRRVREEYGGLSDHSLRRFVYAASEYAIVSSTYFYYIGLERESREVLSIAPAQRLESSSPILGSDKDLRSDTAQYLAYLYNVGSGGIITSGSQEEINQEEFEYLMRCYILASEGGYRFWVANSLQALSELLCGGWQLGNASALPAGRWDGGQVPSEHPLLESGGGREWGADNAAAVLLLNERNVSEDLLPLDLAQRALSIFREYGDVYQMAGAYRSLARCYWQLGAYEESLECLDSALFENRSIERAPDLVSSIREMMSVVYSALDDKPQSDYNRNIYLDLQEETRQDRYLEARADSLNRSVSLLNAMILAVVFLIVMLLVLLFVFNRLRKRRDRDFSIESLLAPLERWKSEGERQANILNERYEEIMEEKERYMLHIQASRRQNVEQRAKVSLVGSVTPFIDRILNELRRGGDSPPLTPSLKGAGSGEWYTLTADRLAYIIELTEQIGNYNELLTEWIQMRQGALSLHIESFALQGIFDIVQKARMGFALKGIDLNVSPTDDWVKADRALTLFMINTIADNARKFTPEGGEVSIGSHATEDYVEIEVRDTGRGMSGLQLEGLFKLNVDIRDSREEGHGFGLLNCRGIIEQYRKLSPLFSVCAIGAESEEERGSRFYFRLPKGIRRALIVGGCFLAALFGAQPVMAVHPARYEKVTPANGYADKAYYANIAGDYEQALAYADSSRMCLNEEYRRHVPNGQDTLLALGSVSAVPPEIKWFRAGLDIDYTIITDIRNESAVAALALHKWDVYRYNNKIYTQLYKEMSADSTLDSYVRVMQRSETNKNVAMIILVLLLLSIFPAYYVLYYRHRLHYRYCVEQIGRINDTLLSNSSEEEKLSEISSINTERFPSMLKNVVAQIITTLKQNVEANNVRQTHLELAADELRRYQLEDDKLHVCNSVLDNCLSTLKHETMYYPARIRQLVESDEQNIQGITEMASYYKELYSTLSMQATRQAEAVKTECKAVPAEAVLGEAYHVAPSLSPLVLLGDADMLSYLFEILLKQSGEKTLSAQLTRKGEQYVEVSVWMPRLALTEEECLNLFTPQSTQNIPYLLCRQIVRDTGESTNARGCGIAASPNSEGGTNIVVTLVGSVKTREKTEQS